MLSKLPRPFTLLIGRDQEAERGADQDNTDQREQVFHGCPQLSPVEWRKQSLPRHPFSCLTLFFGMLSNNLLQRERRTHLPRLQLTACDAAIQRRSGSDRGAACGYDRG